MKVAVIGAGYVGLVQSAGLTHLGHRVRLAEASAARVAQLERGELPIFEPGLAELIERAQEHGTISFHLDNLEAIEGCEVVFLTLPTPTGGDGRANLSIIESVLDQLAPKLDGSVTVAVKSTVPVGTAAKLQKRLRDAGSLAGVVSNPEFLSEGNAVEDFLRAERVVIGAFEETHAEKMSDLYKGLNAKHVITDPASAELIKYGANAYLATRITFFNSLADIADRVGADVLSVTEGIGLDRRIGPHFMKPGPGYGGSCFPKDTRAMVSMAAESGYVFDLLETVIQVNEAHRNQIADRCLHLLGDGAEDCRIGLWGVAFKAGTDDTRESPALSIGRELLARGARVRAYDPEASSEELEMVPTAVEAATDADLLLVATEWPEFLRVDLTDVAKAMKGDVVYDVRNLLDPVKVRAAGLRYVGLGRPEA